MDKASAETKWVDITEELDRACSKLGRNDLVHVADYSPFAAMTAIEIGHPKMDVGTSSVRLMTVEEHLQAERAPMALTPSQVVAVMDGILARLATYMSGQMQAQTVCTSLYLMQAGSPALSAIPALEAFCANAARLCNAVLRVAEASKVIMDDEFPITQTKVASVPLVSPTQADECCDRAKRLLRAHQGMGTRSPAPDAPTADCLSQAMLCRLAMVAETAKALECMEHCTKDGLEKARKPLTSAVEAFKKWEASLVELRAERERAGGSGKGGGGKGGGEGGGGRGVENRGGAGAGVGAGTSGVASASASASACRDDTDLGTLPELVPRWRLPIPRVVEILNWRDTVALWGGLVEHLGMVCELAGVSPGQWGVLRDLLYEWAHASPSLVPRTLFHLHTCYGVDGAGSLLLGSKKHGPRPMRVDGAFLSAHWGVPARVASECRAYGDFLEFAEKALTTWVQIMCLERTWRHRKLRAYLSDWGELYLKAVEAEQSPPFLSLLRDRNVDWDYDGNGSHGMLACWVERECAMAMACHVTTGVEVELVKPTQLRMTYWYLDFLLGVVLQNTRALDNARALPRLAGVRIPRGAPYAPETLRLVAMTELRKCLAQGLLRLVALLTVCDGMAIPPGPFNGEEEWFNQRFAAFHVLSRPDPLTFDQYVASVDMTGVTSQHMAGLTCESFLTAPRLAGVFKNPDFGDASPRTLSEVQQLQRVAAQNITAVSLLAKLGDAAKAMTVGWDWGLHPHYPGMKLTR